MGEKQKNVGAIKSSSSSLLFIIIMIIFRALSKLALFSITMG